MSQSPIDMLSIRESWRMFRILAEIVDGFETLSDLGPCVSIFGSARVKPENPLYAEGETIAKLLVESGYGVIRRRSRPHGSGQQGSHRGRDRRR